MAIFDSSEETTQNEGETDSPDKPSNVSEQQHCTLDVPHPSPTSCFPSDIHVNKFAIITPGPATNFPLPLPDTLISGDKQPGHTHGALQLSAVETSSSSSEQHQRKYPNQQPPLQSQSSPPSTVSSPAAISLTDIYWEGGSLPSSRAASRPSSQPASRAGSMSAGAVSGNGAAPPPHVPTSWRDRRGSKPEAPARKPSFEHSDKGDSISHKFNLKDLLANGPKLNRRNSQRSMSSKGSDAGEGKARSTAGDSAVSLTQKYGVCQKVAIGKGATSVVRLAHKWDRTEEKLYAIKVRRWFLTFGERPHIPPLRNSANVVKTSQKKNMWRN